MRNFKSREKKPFIRKNEQIRISPVRLVDTDGSMLGVKEVQEALYLARQKSLDLVEIAPQAKPPVCKILDYSKYIYETEKKKRQDRKKQKAGLLKEIRLKVRIATHDADTKINKARGFLEKKDKVRLTVIFRGRENQHRDLGRALLMDIKGKLSDIANAEGNVQMMGNRMSLTLMPKI